MPKVAFSKENIGKCLCGECPVQVQSTCAKEKYAEAQKVQGMPTPEQVPGLYCSSGKATCQDLRWVEHCLCPGCLVWAENSLKRITTAPRKCGPERVNRKVRGHVAGSSWA